MKEYKLGDLVLITITAQGENLKKDVYIFNKIITVKKLSGNYTIKYYQSISNPLKTITTTGNSIRIEYLA